MARARPRGVALRLLPLPAPVSGLLGGTSAATRGVLLMLTGALCSSLMNGVIRYISDELHPFEIAFFRNLFGLVALAPLFLGTGIVGALRTERIGLHALRGAFNVVAMLTFFLGVSMTPLATVAALSFTSPLFATLGAVIVLKEVMGVRRWTGLLLGFAGALVILRPGAAALDPGALLIVGSSALWAGALVVIRILARTESSLTTTAWAGVFLTPLSLLAALFVWTWPTPEQFGCLVLIGVLGSCAQLSVAQALREAEATVVLPCDFSKLVWGALIGYLAFAEIPDVWTFAGGTLILASVTYIAYRESRRRVAGEPARLPAPHRPV